MTAFWLVVAIIAGLILAYKWAKNAYAVGWNAASSISTANAVRATVFVFVKHVDTCADYGADEKKMMLAAMTEAMSDGERITKWLEEMND